MSAAGVGILGPMPLEHERAFSAESPVGQYWLGNCVGFRVEGLRGGSGVVEEIGLGPDGVDVLAVRRWGLHLGRTVLIPAARVQAVLPWDDTIVVVSRRRPPSRGAVQTRHLARKAQPVVHDAGAATGRAVQRVSAALGTLLLGVAALVRRHGPHARRLVASAAAATAALARAYGAEARAFWRDEKAAIAAWRKTRRAPVEDEPGDEGPLTRAGADEADARRRERQRS